MFKKIYIEITNICNLKCQFCPETNRKKETMSVKDFEKIISKIHTYTNLICLHVKGEPLLHKELEQILNTLEKYEIKANKVTNGLLIKEKIDIIIDKYMYEELVEIDQWDSERAISIRKKLDQWGKNRDTILDKLDTRISLKRFKRSK